MSAFKTRLTLDNLLDRCDTDSNKILRLAGKSQALPTADGICLLNGAADDRVYTNAQLDDYRGLARRDYPWRPPLRFHVRARFSHGAERLHGTAGFGFWNDPFMMSTSRPPALPRALWYFFASPHSDMALAKGVPGHGWKAATLDARRLSFLLPALTAPVGVPLMRSPRLYEKLWPIAQKALGVSEARLKHDLRTWHDYVIDWRSDAADFYVDGIQVLRAMPAPGGPLGVVIWLDNQAMIVTPQGKLRHTLVARPEQQWLELAEVTITA